jgi:hypothetical protein
MRLLVSEKTSSWQFVNKGNPSLHEA